MTQEEKKLQQVVKEYAKTVTKEQEEKTKDEQQIEQLKKDIAENELVSFWKDEIKINSYKK
jgi:hypothetical protein|tara:strand:+ start:228 stop:410 length:183 start_codon:yes stop_codon:yes gene_type:complete